MYLMKNTENKLQSSGKTNERTRFKKGVSGNPKGRPKQNVKTSDLRQSLFNRGPELIDILFKFAREGNLRAIELLLDRIYPRLKPQILPIEHPIPQGNISSQVQHVFHAAVQGNISIEQAESLSLIAERAVNLSALEANALNHSYPDNLEIANDPIIDSSTSQVDCGVTITAQNPTCHK